ncbi:MAG: hypothetical protein NZ866_02955, partial [Patescibacteria group bacterium]|nr:hypothetical protein [Patescibacteria group bacterium]
KYKYNSGEYTLDELISLNLNKIYARQNYQGGFTFWPYSSYADIYLTLYVLEVLNNLRNIGYPIDEEVFNKGINYININFNKIFKDQAILSKKFIVNLAYRLNNLGILDNFLTLNMMLEQILTDDYLHREASSNELLDLTSIYLNKNSSETGRIQKLLFISENTNLDKNLNKILKTLEKRLRIDGRGAYLASDNSLLGGGFYETTVKNTARYLKLKSLLRDDLLSEKLIRWLIYSQKRLNPQMLFSTQDSIEILNAFYEYLRWKKETTSNFSLEIKLNEKLIKKLDINPKNIFQTFEMNIPLSEIKLNEINLLNLNRIKNNNSPNNFYFESEMKYYLSNKNVLARDEGFTILKSFYYLPNNTQTPLIPANKVKSGEVLLAKIKIIVPKKRFNVAIEDYLPAGMEIVNINLATERKIFGNFVDYQSSKELFPSHTEFRDDKLFLFVNELDPGIYEYNYFVRALVKGKYLRLPSQVWEMYFPENFGRTNSEIFEIE